MNKQDHDNAEAIAKEIADFREGEIPKPTTAHVERWVKQFDPVEQSAILSGTRRLLEKTYLTRKDAVAWLGGLFNTEKLSGKDPISWLKKANFIRGQKHGSSQKDLLELADEVVRERAGCSIDECGAEGGAYLYLDDCLFTGMTVIHDLERWIEEYEGAKCDVHVVTAGTYTSGRHWASHVLSKKGKDRGVKFTFWHYVELSNFKRDQGADADVLRPAVLPNDPGVHAYFDSLNDRGRHLREPAKSYPENHIFASEAERQVLEGAFLKAGVKIRAAAANPRKSIRPLGFMNLDCLGFGATFCTYRNAPNNLPLALWWGDPGKYPASHPLGMWYPLLPRRPKDD